jgi:hypothetical protein
LLVLLGLCAGPAAWALQLVAGYALSSWACFPHAIPARQTPPPGWEGEPIVLLAVNLACLALDLGGLALSVAQIPRRNGSAASNVRVAPTRFLAQCGVIACLGFAGAILVNTANIVMVPACWSITP